MGRSGDGKRNILLGWPYLWWKFFQIVNGDVAYAQLWEVLTLRNPSHLKVDLKRENNNIMTYLQVLFSKWSRSAAPNGAEKLSNKVKFGFNYN